MKVRDIAPPLATGLLLAAAFPSTGMWPLAYIAFVPLLLWLPGREYRKAFLGSLLAGLLFYGITFAWFASLTYWVGGIVLLGVSFLLLFFALFWGVAAVGYCFVLRWLPGGTVVAFPAMWVLLEYIQNRIFTGFGWGSIGYTQWNNLPVTQVAAIGSIYAVGFYIVGINVLLSLFVRYRRKPGLMLSAAAAIVVLGIAVPVWGKMRMATPDMSSSLDVGVIQPNFSLDVKWSSEYRTHTLETQKRLTENVVAQGAELVVWPESALFGFLMDEFDEVAEVARSHNVYLLTGSNHYEYSQPPFEDFVRYYNSAFLLDPRGKVLGRYDKRHLAPFGEYVPLAGIFPFMDKVVPQVADFTPGEDITLFDIAGKKFCVLICFENSFPHLVRAAAALGADFLVQLTNDGWFGHTAQPKQDLAIAVFRAVENGVTLIRGTNTGISCFIDPWGRIRGVVRAPWGETVFVRGSSVETISAVAHKTFYKAHGDIWVLGCLLVLAAVIGISFYRRTTHIEKTETGGREGAK